MFIDIETIVSFCNRLQSCVAAAGGHSEHYNRQLTFITEMFKTVGKASLQKLIIANITASPCTELYKISHSLVQPLSSRGASTFV